MVIGVPRETSAGEQRVALIPAAIASLLKAGVEVVVESGAGQAAGYPDAAYRDHGAHVSDSRAEVYAAETILRVRAGGADPSAVADDLRLMRPGQRLIGLLEPLWEPAIMQRLATHGIEAYALELIPRISRAQSMDVLSSMATIAGYKAVLLAATSLPKIFPLLMTAAGTLAAARVLVIGVGVAGLQAIATARRLGAVVEAYDVRPAVREQVQSLGAKFVELPLETDAVEDSGGYARSQDETFYQRQRDLMTTIVARNDVVITTAAIPGKRPPLLVTAEMVRGMQPGSVIVDLAAERGGNCELTRPGQTVTAHGVTIIGPTNLPATVPYHASQMYSRNIATFVLHLLKQGASADDSSDEILRETRVTHGGRVVHPAVLALLDADTAPTQLKEA